MLKLSAPPCKRGSPRVSNTCKTAALTLKMQQEQYARDHVGRIYVAQTLEILSRLFSWIKLEHCSSVEVFADHTSQLKTRVAFAAVLRLVLTMCCLGSLPPPPPPPL